MTEEPKPKPTPSEELSEAVRRAMTEAADLRDLEERMRVLCQHASDVTKPRKEPEEPES